MVYKKNKNVFKLAFSFHAFPKISEMVEADAHKKFNFQHYCETKISQIIIFWSNRGMKMQQNIVFRLNREIKMPQN